MCMNSLMTLSVVMTYQFAFEPIHYTEAGHLCLFNILYAVLTLPILSVFV